MSILQEISKRLLAVANLPPEQRNDALIQVLIYIEEIQYDMVLEQKQLIMSVIEDLIAENDADQIAKSKLVFVEDVEEQIAPTKKTRAKKVVTPTAEVKSEDLPDFIEKLTLVKDLPEPVKKLIGLRRMQQAQTTSIALEDTIWEVLDWGDTPEGYQFWYNIHYEGDLREFKEKFGNKGEKVDELVMFAELNNFAEEFLNTEELEDLPNFINSEMNIEDLPEKIKLLALQRQKDAGNIPNENLSLDALKVNGNFDWIETPEGNAFWEIIYADGDLREFKKLYGNKGEGVDAIINASALAPAPAPRVKKQKLIFLRLIFNPPVGSAIKFELYNPTELYTLVIDILANLNVSELIFGFEAVSDFSSYLTKAKLYSNNSTNEMVDILIEQFDTFVNPELDWTDFVNNGTDFLRIKENNGIVNDAFKPKAKPVVQTEEVKAVEIIFYPPSGGIINIKCDSLVELHETAIYIMKNTKPKPKYLTFSTITNEASYSSKFSSVKSNQDDFYVELKEKLLDIWKGKPSFDWKEFDEKIADTDKIQLNEKIINDSLKPEPKPVVTPKVVAPKPVEKPKPVKSTPKPKVTKPKVEDDLSFLNDLDNIF